MKPISSFTQGMLDYTIGIVLILAPQIFQFAAVGGPAVAVPRIVGLALIVTALFTNFELGVVRVIPMRLHLAVDIVAGIILALSPFMFGFYNLSYNAWLPHLLVGLAELVIVYNTQTETGLAARYGTGEGGIRVAPRRPDEEPPRKRANE